MSSEAGDTEWRLGNKASPSRAAAPTPTAGDRSGRAASLLPALALPKGGGAIRGIGEKLSSNPATGTGSLSVPIATSPGRAGFQLGLSLDYDSGSGNGPFGLGWHLSTPAITRKTDKGLPRYEESDEPDVFMLAGAEDLVPVGNAAAAAGDPSFLVQRFRPRIEGLFARIERWTQMTGDSHWRVTTRDNVTSLYGQSPAARIADPDDGGRIFSWLLEETRDDSGNVVRYVYKPEDGAGVDLGRPSEANRFVRLADGSHALRATTQRYLKRIYYGNRMPVARGAAAPLEPSAWMFEVVLDFGDHADPSPSPEDSTPWPVRPDPFSTYRAGFEVRTYRRCARVLMFHRFAELGGTPYLVRSTNFAYPEEPGDHGYGQRHAGSYLLSVTQSGYRRTVAGATERAMLPALDLRYIEPRVHSELRSVKRESLEGLPGGVDSETARWVDLDGEGIPGVLTATERAWSYKANLGGGVLAPPLLLRSLPSPAELGGGVQQLTDLAGAGQLDLVQYTPPAAGYFSRTAAGGWSSFAWFRELPVLDWNDPNLRFLDLDGDGHADLLITEQDALVWHRSRAKDGFEPAVRIAKATDESDGPAVVFADGTETIQLADMSGDGLVDIVRVRNGEVCYWPNLGHGRFGRKVTMDRSPRFDLPDRFDPGHVRLADVDGSGTTDVLYVGDQVTVFFNQAGNGWSGGSSIGPLPIPHAHASVRVIDLLGQGTSCLVWSSPLPGDSTRPLLFVDLMGGRKPHLLEQVVNNLGAETRLSYASSTRFYLADKARGAPWITRLAFPVHVVDRIERHDHVARTRLVTRFAYHHGYFDSVEREFRGFAFVEQWDAESIGADRGKGRFADVPDEVDGELRLPPVLTRTWFHTGAWLEQDRLERALAGAYYAGDPVAPAVPETILPGGLSTREEREAARALRGQILRQEVFAADGSAASSHPYTVSGRSFEVRLVEHARGDGHAAFFTHPRETLTLHYERRVDAQGHADDPRMQHELVLAVDELGNVTRSASIAYPRRVRGAPDAAIAAEQARLWATVTDRRFANHAGEVDWYRIGLPIESRTSELTGLDGLAVGGAALSVSQVRDAIAAAEEIPYEDVLTAASAGAPGDAPELRVVERERQLYYDDALTAALPVGQVASHARPYQTYRLAFTPGLIAAAFNEPATTRVTDLLLRDRGRYAQGVALWPSKVANDPEDALWWAPSGRAIFDRARFLLPIEAIDPFGSVTAVEYDAYALLATATKEPRIAGDALSGQVESADVRFGSVARVTNDYRVLGPVLHTDCNRDRTAVAVDALGLVVKMAVMGKVGASDGDTLDDPTTRIEYDLQRFRTSGKPVVVRALARERHGGANPRWQESYAYLDGSGREAMKKVQAEPGLAPVRGADGQLVRATDGSLVTAAVASRWVGTGRTVFDNKGNPVKQYEPFFSATFEYEDERDLVEWGVTPILRYDPVGRLIRTDLPNGTSSQVVFDAWRQETWDENDTVEGTPWLASRQAGGVDDRRCAALSLAHARTPAVAHLDALGRPFLTVADNGAHGQYATRLALDVEGNQRAIAVESVEPGVAGRRPLTISTQAFDLLGRAIHTRSVDAGESRALMNAADQPLVGWDPRGHTQRHAYDALRRPSHVFVARAGETEALVTRLLYGEAHPNAASRRLRGRAHAVYDGAGVLTSARFDIDGHRSESTRRLARQYDDRPDWSALAALSAPAAVAAAAAPLLERDTFTTLLTYDALGRVTSQITPDASETRPTYNEASLLERVEVRVRGAAAWTPLVTSLEYDARGQRMRIEYGNGAITSYRYDDETFRLIELTTTRVVDGAVLQSLRYHHDPVGNLVAIADGVSFGNPAVSADGRYEYDALYRLVAAEGREHPGQQPTDVDPVLHGLPSSAHPNDFQALRRYAETYAYDRVGNIQRVAHQGQTGWTRRHAYVPGTNRLLATSLPGDGPGQHSATYAHDPAGNMTRMPHLSVMEWDHANRLQHVVKQVATAAANDVYFTYDAGGERARKVYVHGGLLEERIYLGGYELYRKRSAATGALQLERQTLHVMDDRQRVAMIETKTVDKSVASLTITPRTRHQLDNHLGTAVLELDHTAKVISFEEYFPYGGTSFHAADPAAEVSAKRYRYTGKEKDEETGLCYHRARYYAPWLGRWASCDPAGMIDGASLYQYARANPIGFADPTGTQSQETRSHVQADFEPLVIEGTVPTPQAVNPGAPTAGMVCSACHGGTGIYATPFAIPPSLTPEQVWRSHQDRSSGLTTDAAAGWRDTDADDAFDRTYTRPAVHVLSYGVRGASVVGGPNLFMFVNEGMDTADSNLGWDTSFGEEGRIIRNVTGLGWGLMRTSMAVGAAPPVRGSNLLPPGPGPLRPGAVNSMGQLALPASADAMAVYRAANATDDVLVIGRLPDTVTWWTTPGHQVLGPVLGTAGGTARIKWTLGINDSWMQGGINRGAPFRLGTTPSNATLQPTLWGPVVTERELVQLMKAGYIQQGNFMVLPK